MKTMKGVIRNGVVVLEGAEGFPEGSDVIVELATEAATECPEPISELLLRFAGSTKGDYPIDFAQNHDLYIHGARRRALP